MYAFERHSNSNPFPKSKGFSPSVPHS
jgi:hypothetical protein